LEADVVLSPKVTLGWSFLCDKLAIPSRAITIVMINAFFTLPIYYVNLSAA
jgi:hypothetical protein